MNWTDEPLGPSLTLTMIDLALQHALWIIQTVTFVEPDVFRRTRVLLSGSGPTKILVDETALLPGPTPEPVATFLARHWELLRPDLMYLLDGLALALTNRFLIGWSKTENLDLAHPKVDSALHNRGPLKKLPTGMSAPSADVIEDRPLYSVRALESRAALGARFLADP